jgi:hypothetical protein
VEPIIEKIKSLEAKKALEKDRLQELRVKVPGTCGKICAC